MARLTRIRQLLARLVVSVVVMISILLVEFAMLPGIVTPGSRAPILGQQAQLAEQLDRAIETISEIEARVEARRALDEKLEEKKQTLAEKVLELDQEELEAVAVQLAARVPVVRESGRAVWIDVTKNVLIGAVFFLLGMWVQHKRRSGIRL
jgi:hypothetical protein